MEENLVSSEGVMRHIVPTVACGTSVYRDASRAGVRKAFLVAPKPPILIEVSTPRTERSLDHASHWLRSTASNMDHISIRVHMEGFLVNLGPLRAGEPLHSLVLGIV